MPSPDVEVYRALAGALSTLGLRWYLFGAQAAILHGAHERAERIEIEGESIPVASAEDIVVMKVLNDLVPQFEECLRRSGKAL